MIDGNRVGTPGDPLSGSRQSNAVDVRVSDAANVTLAVINNELREWKNSGLRVISFDTPSNLGGGTTNATIMGNAFEITTLGTSHNPYAGIELQSGFSAAFPDNHILNALVVGNAIQVPDGANATAGIQLNEQFDTDMNLTQGSSTSTDAAQVARENNSIVVGIGGFLNDVLVPGGPVDVVTTSPPLPLLVGSREITTESSDSEPDVPNTGPDSAPLPLAEQGSSQPFESVDLTENAAETTSASSDIAILRQADLDLLVEAAIQRWSVTGLSEDQIAVLESTTVAIADMPGWNLGSYDGETIRIDTDAGTFGWFVDATPLDDSEFGSGRSATRFLASPDAGLAEQIDLLSTVMHELGHALGLADSYSFIDRDNLMYGLLVPGERRLPTEAQAKDAIAGSIESEAFQVGPLDLGTLPDGKGVMLTFLAQIAASTSASSVSNQGTVTADGPITQLTDDPTTSATTDPTVTQIDPSPVSTSFSFLLQGLQEVPPVVTTSSGSCLGVLNAAQTSLQVDCTHDVAGATAAHIHRGPVGQNGPVLFPFSSGASPLNLTQALTPADVADLLADDLYVNVHSSAFPGGELRGQLTNTPVPLPTLLNFALDGLQENPPVQTTSSGSCLGVLNAAQTSLQVDCTHDVAGATAAHIHRGPVGQNGPVLFPFSSGASPLNLTQALTPADVADLLADDLYVNVHSSAFPGGELRGQITNTPVPLPIPFDFPLRGLQEVPPVVTTASGSCNGFLNADQTVFDINCTHDVSGATAAHIHRGAVGSNGPVVIPFSSGTSPLVLQWDGSSTPPLDPGLVQELRLGEFYVNVHSPAFPGGELRGQIISRLLNEDFGDAPDPLYPTLRTNNGARHPVGGPLFLGTCVDGDASAQPSALAIGDDVGIGTNTVGTCALGDDEDGVTLPPLLTGSPVFVGVSASLPGLLSRWIDWNSNGSWADAGDQVFTNEPLNAGSNLLPLVIPPSATPTNQTFARFRLSSTGGLSFTGPAADGEVEDYAVRIIGLDFGDAPDPRFPTLRSSNGARHAINGTPLIVETFTATGRTSFALPGTQTPTGVGFSTSSSLSSITFTPGAVTFRGQPVDFSGTEASWLAGSTSGSTRFPINSGPATVTVTGSGSLFGGVVGPASVQIPGVTLGPGFSASNLDVTTGSTSSQQTTSSWNSTVVPQLNGARVTADCNQFNVTGVDPVNGIVDWSCTAGTFTVPQLPFLGTVIPDPDIDGQFSANADGDDNDADGDDDDGVVFTSPLVSCHVATVDVTASVAGSILNAWIDWNGNLSWADAGDHVFVDTPLPLAGVNSLSFVVPCSVASGQSFARFRVASAGGLSFVGGAADGEVEDYGVTVAKNSRPELAPISNQLAALGAPSHTVTLSATDADNDPLLFSATATRLEFFLDQLLDLSAHPQGFFENAYRGGEKWLYSFSRELWYYILVTGGSESLFEWDGTPNALSGTFVSNLNPGTHANPLLLAAAAPLPVTVNSVGNLLTITKTPAFEGTVVITAVVNDRHGGIDFQDFQLTYPPLPPQTAPVLAPLTDQTSAPGASQIAVKLSATDINNDPLTFSATLVFPEVTVDQQLDLSLHPAGLFENFYRGGEKWMYSFSGNKWYYILPNEELYEWDLTPFTLSGTLIATLSPGTHANPALLYDASSNPFPATVSVIGDMLTVTKTAGFFGTAVVTVTVDDGQGGQDTGTFRARFLQPRPASRSSSGDASYRRALDVVLSKDDLLGDVMLDEQFGDLFQHTASNSMDGSAGLKR